jgi:threonylcarbamoyladenosine tRNA methylthiotransferase MtaB
LLPDHVPPPEKQARAARLRAAFDRLAVQFRRQFVGQTVEVLWEDRRDGLWRGLTDNYLRVTARSEGDLARTVAPVRLTALIDDSLHGVLL